VGKASRTKQAPDRRARVAAQREAAQRAEQRKRIYIAGGSVIAVIVVVLAFVLVKLNSNGGTAAASSNGPTGTALTSVVNNVTSVPTATLDKVGSGSGQVSSTPIIPIKGSQPPLTSGGKPEMLYMGAEYCPYCAAERWPMIVALSRFGTFSGLQTTHSSSSDVDANTPTWTFYGSTYTSKYLNFTSVEETKNYRPGNSSDPTVPYVTLQTPTAAQQALMTKYDNATYDPPLGSNSGSIPFVDFGNKYMIAGASYNPQNLAGKTWAQIATALKDPSSRIAQGVDGTANYITATICKLTGNQPATACTSGVQSLEGQL
jgi:thiol-disulfide isomerase/thioredoxin